MSLLESLTFWGNMVFVIAIAFSFLIWFEKIDEARRVELLWALVLGTIGIALHNAGQPGAAAASAVKAVWEEALMIVVFCANYAARNPAYRLVADSIPAVSKRSTKEP